MVMVMLTRHVDGVGEEVCEVGDEDDETTLRLWHPSHVGELQHQRCSNAHHDADEQTSEEDAEENAKGFKQADYAK